MTRGPWSSDSAGVDQRGRRPVASNVEKLLDTLKRFGFGEIGLKTDDFLQPGAVVQLGYPPSRIDLLTAIDGVEFDACYARRLVMNIAGVDLPIIASGGIPHQQARCRACQGSRGS